MFREKYKCRSQINFTNVKSATVAEPHFHHTRNLFLKRLHEKLSISFILTLNDTVDLMWMQNDK